MIRQRIYYGVKPIVPWSVRMGIRRWFAARQRRHALNRWPIAPGSEQPPRGWPGWPDGKRFALVLTHDVEGQAGMDKCRSLMELERNLGFRSSFNFVPEGEYRVPPELREELTRFGFEVGIHDLHHDGSLYRNASSFREQAGRINYYLRQWGAVGFRSGFMFHNLDWLHQVQARYDASTFDTDPFEPQDDGVGTIFPFWVPAVHEPNREGYVELPYTLAQDSTLFLLFRESSPEIWIRKLDWVAGHGGMALLNVHPDYMRFPGEKRQGTYPDEFYSRLLEYVRDRYQGEFWNPLPREISAFVEGFRPLLRRHRPRRIGMVTHSFYKSDGRVTRYAETLATRGDSVEVFCLRRSASDPRREIINGVEVHAIKDRFGKKERSRLSYLLPLLQFLVATSLKITHRHLRRRYDLLHIHNVPDFLVFAAWLPKLSGTPIILDIHDIVPEFYASKFGGKPSRFVLAGLKQMEQWSAGFASHVIMSNHLWLDRYVARTGSQGKCSVFINNVNSDVFRLRPRTRTDSRTIILFPGGLQWHQGVDIAIRAFQKVSRQLPSAEFHIYGDGIMKPSLISLAKELGLEQEVRFFDPLSMREIAEVMANADLGVVPKRADSFGNEAYSTKIMEFMSLGVPVAISSTKVDRFYFNDTVARFFDSGDPEAMAEAMLALLNNTDLRQQKVERALEYAHANNWESRREAYLQLVDELCCQIRTQPRPTPTAINSNAS